MSDEDTGMGGEHAPFPLLKNIILSKPLVKEDTKPRLDLLGAYIIWVSNIMSKVSWE